LIPFDNPSGRKLSLVLVAMHLFSRMKDRRKVRRLLAATFLMLAFLDLSSHALTDSRDASGSQTWCIKFHYTHPEIDCPHKRDHQSPDKYSFDEASHLAVLLTQDDLRAPSGISYRSEAPVSYPKSLFLSRSLEPPIQPPKQA